MIIKLTILLLFFVVMQAVWTDLCWEGGQWDRG